MKKCPACEKEFPDSMRFCQTDGTLLTEKVEDVDPYKTIVGGQNDIASSMPPLDPFKTMVAGAPPKPEDDILDLPAEQDSLKTMIVSKDELKAEMPSGKKEDFAPLDIPPPSEPYAPSAPLIQPKPKAAVNPTPPNEPPAPKNENPFSMPPNFSDSSNDATAVIDKNQLPPTPPLSSSPFESKPFENDFSGKSPYGNQENKPIPSPFDLSMPPGYMPPSVSPFEDAKPPAKDFTEPSVPAKDFAQPNQSSPFDSPSPFGNADPFGQNQPVKQDDWTPPPAPDANWQNQAIGSNSPLQPPVAGQGLNQTLPIISLVLGIISLCCYIGWITGPAALILGYMGMKNANNDPNQYGGKGLAIAGMITGGIFTLIWIIYWLFIILVYAGLFAGGAFSR